MQNFAYQPEIGDAGTGMREGDDFVCPNCSCEIRLVRHGDPEKMGALEPFTCCCGTIMEKAEAG